MVGNSLFSLIYCILNILYKISSRTERHLCNNLYVYIYVYDFRFFFFISQWNYFLIACAIKVLDPVWTGLLG